LQYSYRMEVMIISFIVSDFFWHKSLFYYKSDLNQLLHEAGTCTICQCDVYNPLQNALVHAAQKCWPLPTGLFICGAVQTNYCKLSIPWDHPWPPPFSDLKFVEMLEGSEALHSDFQSRVPIWP
jgi:hypothetical protein